MEISVNLSNLCKDFEEITAVDDISFKATKGEVLGFLGPNGAGKSTTMKMITGFLTPTSGNIIINGIDMLESPLEAKRCIGYLPEGAPAYQDMTPKQFLDFIAEIRGFHGEEKARRVESVVDKIHLKEVLQQPIETLSKGFKRRVGLAQAILHDPSILILDEPTDGLDPNQKHEVRSLIKEMAAEKVIILSTHLLEEVDAVCTRAIIIAGGKLVADATPKELEAQAPSYRAVTIGLSHQQAELAQPDLEALKGLQKLEILKKTENTIYFKALPNQGKDLLPDISQLSLEKRWQLRELMVETGRLDEYFRNLTADIQQRN